MASMWRATVSGAPKASVSRTSSSHVTLDRRSAMARKPGWRAGWASSMRSGMMKRRNDAWYHISKLRASSSAWASVSAT